MAKKNTKNTFKEYKLRVETKDVEALPIRLTLFPEQDGRQGAQLLIAGSLVLKGFWVVNGKNGPFVSAPSYKDRSGNWQDYFFPMDDTARESLYTQIIKLSAFKDQYEEEEDEF